MTEEIFILIHTTAATGIIYNDDQININTTSTGNPNEVELTSIVVPVTPLLLNGSTSANIETAIQYMDNITFKLADYENGSSIQLEIVDRTHYESATYDFFYLKVVPKLLIKTSQLGISPNVYTSVRTHIPVHLFTEISTLNEYSHLVNNGNENRKSKRIRQSERSETATNPTNLTNILNLTATKASVQDSNYTSTPWINARYNGSKSTTSNYGGVPPFITGTSFIAEVSESIVLDAAICTAPTVGERNYKEYLHTGNRKYPIAEYESLTVATESIVDIPDTVNATLTYTLINSGTALNRSISIGDVIRMRHLDTAPASSGELLRVISHNYVNSTIVVERQYEGTVETTTNVTVPLLLLKPVKVFRLNSSTSKLELVESSKLYLEDQNNIVYTDAYGVVYGEVECT